LIVILILVVVVFGFFTLAVAFGVTLTLIEQVPALRAFTEVPEIEQNFFVVTATTSTTLAPLGILTLAVLLMVVKEVILPFFITAIFETTAVGVFVLVPVLTDEEETPHGTLFTRTQIVLEAIAPVPRMRYFVEVDGQTTKVAFPFEAVFADNVAEQPALVLTPMARTLALIELADTPPLAQIDVTLSVEETSPPCSQLEPELTVSTDWETPEIGALSSSTKSVSMVTPPVESVLMSVSGVDGSASVSFAGVDGSASGNVALMLAMNDIGTVSVSEVNVHFLF
jgi:hypothetical protein